MTVAEASQRALKSLQQKWLKAWPQALADWSPFVQLREPIWCFSEADETRESLTASFAMIRLVDHSVVISLQQVLERGLMDFAVEILAHEIGHHVYCPADLNDNARMLARMRHGLPGCEAYAPMVANLYGDLLINDRLQRSCGRNMAGVYLALGKHAGNASPNTSAGHSGSKLWSLYLRIYELLWSLPPRSLTPSVVDERINQDAVLGTRLVRSYAKDWLGGGGRFACLLLPYIVEEAEAARQAAMVWCDALTAGAGGCPDGLVELDDDELSGAIHPAEDPELSGLDPLGEPSSEPAARIGKVASELSGRKSIKSSHRDPFEYAEILKASGVALSDRDIAVHYYRERALPHLIPFPARRQPLTSDPIPGGLDLWDPSGDIDQIDWIGTLTASPTVIPGVTTRERLIGSTPGAEPNRVPLDLYLGVDCSGSMHDPARTLSYPVLAGTIMALSALRAGARVKVVLSGEPGSSVSTDGFVRDRRQVLNTLLNYLGTGYAFGIHRLRETFLENAAIKRPVHVLVISDSDLFQILDESADGQTGWDVARQSASLCGGGATYVLQFPSYELPGHKAYQRQFGEQLERMRTDGWGVHLVDSMEELLTFARLFTRQNYI